ncbi:MAG: rane protein [Bacteroidetes bacterium]|nr:rane protein [Bacteroidota bacterium]
MIKYLKQINLIGWSLGILTTVLYILTSEPTLSFWDSGEYISTAAKLQVGHPPGAPLYQILGAFFSIFSFGNLKLIPIMVNSLSAVSAGITVTFVFWIIVRLLDRYSVKHIGNIIAGIVGALTLAFTDSFWNNAIEAEVYALSTLFTAISFWIILKWDEKPNPRYIILIAFIIGLSIGIHFLNLLVIPAIMFVMYFHNRKPSPTGIISTFLSSLLIIGAMIWGIIPGLLKVINLNPSIIISIILGLLAVLIFISQWKRLAYLNFFSLCFTFFLIGYSCFFVLVIRADAGTPINEFKPNNAERLVSYLNRDAYGDTPLLYGPSYTALPPKDFELTSKGIQPIFDDQMMMFFPRMWNYNNPAYETGYVDWVGMPEDSVIVDSEVRAKPSWKQNLKFLANYQVGYMYVRYLLWNFSGKTNDIQGYGDFQDGQWVTGIEPVDKFIGRDTTTKPHHRESMGNNIYFAIPLILAIIGLFYQIGRDANGFIITSTLFFFTGIAIIFYLNEHAYQPRERDYAYVGSFMVFSIWVAMGAFAISQWLVNIVRVKKPKYVLPLFLAVPALLFANNFNDHNRSFRYTAFNLASSMLKSCQENAILFVNGDNDTFPLWYCQEIEGIRTDVRVINLQLLNNPEYIEQLTKQTYKSSPIKIQASKEIYYDIGRSISLIRPDINYYELNSALKTLYSEKSASSFQGFELYTLPSNKLYLTIGLGEKDTIGFVLENTDLTKSNMMILDIIANNIDDRAIYFSNYSNDDFLGLNNYLRLEGFSYRLSSKLNPPQNLLVETKTGFVDSEAMYDNLMHNFSWKNFNKKGIYYDELHRSVIDLYAQNCSLLAHTLLSEGENEKALAIANLCIEKLPPTIHYYPYTLAEISLVYARLGEKEKAQELMAICTRSFSSEIKYYLNLSPKHQSKNRLHEQKLIAYWINLCDITEEWELEELRVQLADGVFEYLSPYVLSCYEQLSRLKAKPLYYESEIKNLEDLLNDINTFAKKYEEPIPQIKI